MPHKKECTGRSNQILFSTYLDEKGKACKTTYFMHLTPIKLFPKDLVNVFYVAFSVLVPRGADTLYAPLSPVFHVDMDFPWLYLLPCIFKM